MQSYTALNDSNIQLAAYQWVTNNVAALGTYGDIRNWDTSRITNMNHIFGKYNSNNIAYTDWSKSFNGNVSAWNTSQVTSMSWMFYGASFL